MNPDDPFASLQLPDRSQLPPMPLVRFEGWRAFVGTVALVRPQLPSMADFEAMTAAEKKTFATGRKRYHAKFGPIETPTLTRIHEEALQLASLNYAAPPGVRAGIILDGLGTLGKSTIVVELGRKYELSLRKKLKRPLGQEQGALFVPVLYVTLPGELTIRSLNRLIAQFLGIPGATNGDVMWLNEQIINTAIECGLSLVIIDDIHFLKMKNRTAQDINNHLKYLASSMSATFVYAGIDIEHTGLLSEGSSLEREKFSQTRHRFKRYKILPFEEDAVEFGKLVRSFERHLLLMAHEAESLQPLVPYIHDRTNGYIGAVSALLREGANLAIETGVERLNQEVLDQVRLDYGAEQHSRIVLRSRAQARRSKLNSEKGTSKKEKEKSDGSAAKSAAATQDGASS